MRSRLMLGPVAAVLMAIAFSGVAAADSVTGQTGNYIMNDHDSAGATGAICRYTDIGNLTFDIYKITARAPSVWWMNTNSTNTTQHGQVGWRMLILKQAPGTSTWTVLTKSSIQKKTAYEDQLVPYGNATKAPFTNMSLSINASSFPNDEHFMVRVKVFWYRSDGTVKGSVSHDVAWNEWRSGTTFEGINPFCPRRFFS